MLLGNILEARGDDRQLVDNEAFINWASTYTVYPPEDSEGGTGAEGADGGSTDDVPALPQFAASRFDSEAGA